MTIEQLVRDYLFVRAVERPVVDRGEKILEEAAELFAAWRTGEMHEIAFEVADVVMVASIMASQVGLTVEQCIELKISKDRGRGKGGAKAVGNIRSRYTRGPHDAIPDGHRPTAAHPALQVEEAVGALGTLHALIAQDLDLDFRGVAMNWLDELAKLRTELTEEQEDRLIGIIEEVFHNELLCK